jgi:hypothetical protein
LIKPTHPVAATRVSTTWCARTELLASTAPPPTPRAATPCAVGAHDREHERDADETGPAAGYRAARPTMSTGTGLLRPEGVDRLRQRRATAPVSALRADRGRMRFPAHPGPAISPHWTGAADPAWAGGSVYRQAARHPALRCGERSGSGIAPQEPGTGSAKPGRSGRRQHRSGLPATSEGTPVLDAHQAKGRRAVTRRSHAP